MRVAMSDRLVHMYAIIACILFTVSGSRTDSIHMQKAQKRGILQTAGEK